MIKPNEVRALVQALKDADSNHDKKAADEAVFALVGSIAVNLAVIAENTSNHSTR